MASSDFRDEEDVGHRQAGRQPINCNIILKLFLALDKYLEKPAKYLRLIYLRLSYLSKASMNSISLLILFNLTVIW